MVERHRAAYTAPTDTAPTDTAPTDTAPTEPKFSKKALQRLERLERDALQLRAWLAANPEDRRGTKGTMRHSNRTDNESEKTATSKGVIQGYTRVATVDAQHANSLTECNSGTK